MRTGAVVLFAASAAFAAGGGLPGDNGKPGDGVPAVNPGPRPPQILHAKTRAPSIALAVEAAQAIAAGCKRFALGVAVVDAAGKPILIYLPDGSEASHGYMALRKAFSAIIFRSATSQAKSKVQQDTELASQVRADPNLVAYSGGILLKVGDETVGAIGVSGAEPGGHDEECGLIGLKKIKDQLK